MSETTQTIRMTTQQKRKLRQLATAFGYTIGRGREAEWGSIRKLVLAIADGDLKIEYANGKQQ